MELATSIVCEETEEGVAQEAVMRLAAFGFGSVQNLAVSNPEDIDLATKDYEELAGASTTVKLFIRRLHFATQVFHPANETQGGGQGNTGDSSAPLNAAATTCAPFPREVLDSLRLQNQALERANKKPRKSNTHLGQDDDQSDDDVFDITGALDDAGLHEFHRPEHIEQKLYGAAKQACKKAHRKGRPWVSEKTSDLLHGFVPNASDRFDPDPQRANRLSQRKFFESFIHFYRHAQTWAQSNAASLAGAAAPVKSVLKQASPEGINVCGLANELKQIQYPDAVGDALLQGFPIAGPLHSPGLNGSTAAKKATSSVEELLRKGSDMRRLRERCQGVQDEDPVTKEIWRQTKAEVGLRLGFPELIDMECSSHGVLTARFGVQQSDSKGQVKIRTIDDFRMSGVNATTSTLHCIRHDHVDDLAKIAADIHRAGHRVAFIKADFKSAYRTVPIKPEDIPLAKLVVRDTDAKQWVTVDQWALPFGASAAVYGWERVGGAITAVLRSIGLPILRYVDDLFLAVPLEAGPAAREALEIIVDALGWKLEPTKTHGPSVSMVILGLAVDCSRDCVLQVQPDGAKVQMWVSRAPA